MTDRVESGTRDTAVIVDDDDSASVVERVLRLAQKITDLLESPDQTLENATEAENVAYQIKPHIDRLCTLKRLLDPVDRIIENSDSIKDLRGELEKDMERISSAQDELGPDDRLSSEIGTQLQALKDDSKIVVRELAPDDRAEERERPKKRRRTSLLDLPVAERMERIFGDRFIRIEQVENILRVPLADPEREEINGRLQGVWKSIFQSESLAPYVKRGYVKTLQRTFADFALLFRCPSIAGEKNQADCSIAALRDQFPTFFTHLGSTPWYARYEFFDRPMGPGHWVLVDRQHLNCTFRKPLTRLQMFAEANNLSARLVRQKSAVEEVYDRIVLELALSREFFSNCNALTRSTYLPAKGEARKTVYVYVKDGQIRISGKKGIPHWRFSRARWPGVLPSVVFDI